MTEGNETGSEKKHMVLKVIGTILLVLIGLLLVAYLYLTLFYGVKFDLSVHFK